MNSSVSVLIPAYNVEAFLSQCLESVVNQTYRNVQVVVVDDGSTDGTWAIAQQFADCYSFVEAYHQENTGITLVRKALLSHAKGDYIIFVDGDDWIEADMVERMLSTVERTGSDVVVCGNIQELPGETKYRPFVAEALTIQGNENVVGCLLRHKDINGSLCNKLVKRKFYENITFYKDIWYGEDCIITWQVLNNGVEKLHVMPDCLYHYRMNADSITHLSFNYKKMNGHLVWKIISQETKQKWPNLYHVAMGTFVQQDIMLLYFAAQSNYKSDKPLNEIKKNVRENMHYMKDAGISNPRRLLLGYSLSCAYPLASSLIRLLFR